MFLAAMRDKSRKEEWDHKPPAHLTADGMDAWYMMQRKREQEMRLRRQEAEKILRGYRGPYFSDDASAAWSPRSHRKSRSSFGQTPSESLIDPSQIEKRRQSTMPRLENYYDDDGSQRTSNDQPRKRLGPERTEFLNERQHYDGTQYERAEGNAFENGRSIFRDSEGRPIDQREMREPGATFDPSRFIDVTASQGRLSEASGRRSLFSYGSSERDDIPGAGFQENEENVSDVPETVWRDFISPGKQVIDRKILLYFISIAVSQTSSLHFLEPGAKYPPEAGRYHLYASYACPGSHRALIVRALKGLEDVISVTIVHPTWRHTNRDDPHDKHRGWVFADPNGEPFPNTTGRGGPFPASYPGNEPDPILGAFSVRELYEYARDTSGKYTIPLLWDKKLGTIVNNESSDISYMLNSCFNDFSSNPELDLYTEDDEDGLDKLNEISQWLYPMMIHGVYRCGFAKTQKAYDHAIEELTAAFDMADELLQRQRYLTGDTLTDADIRLFVTLLRFDEVYAFYFRANTRLVMLTPALLNFCREIYQMPGIAETCQMEQIKAHFFGSHAEWNKYSVIPRGLGFIRLLDLPHDRDQFEKR